MTSQLAKLAQRIDSRYIQQKPGAYEADYCAHGTVKQYLIGILGAVPRTEILREIYDDEKLTGCLMRMTVTIDGVLTSVEDAGASDNPQDKTNADRLKSAISDAYKRCAAQLGCTLHLWCGDLYFLDKALAKREEGRATAEQPNPRGGVDASGPAVADAAPPHSPADSLLSNPTPIPNATDDGGTRGGGPSSVAQGRLTRIYQLAKAAGVDATEFARSEQLLAEDEPLDVLMDSDRIVSSSKLAARLEALGKGKK